MFRNQMIFAILYMLFEFILGKARNLLSIYDNWVSPTNSSLPVPNFSQSIGYSLKNHTIWLLGGELALNQLVAFKLDSHTFIDYGANFLPFKVTGPSTQINNILYINNGTDLFRFNVDLLNLEHFVSIPYNVSVAISSQEYPSSGCLTSVGDQYLVVAGGRAIVTNMPIDVVFILNCRCITNAASTALYVIGPERTVDVLDVSDIHNMASKFWTVLPNQLATSMTRHTLLLYGNDIICFGGYYCCESYVHTMNVIDMKTGMITQVPSPPGLSLAGIAAIVVGNVAYKFGGQDHYESPYGYPRVYYDTWSYAVLPTFPTPLPTKPPTNVPTDAPSINPSARTKMPSLLPSFLPSRYPTVHTTFDPSIAPSLTPTIPQTNINAISPTFGPSVGEVTEVYRSSINTTQYEVNGSSGTNTDINSLYIAITICSVLAVLIVITFVAIVIYIRKWKKDQIQANEKNVTELVKESVTTPEHNVVPVTQTEPDLVTGDTDEGDGSIEIMYVNEHSGDQTHTKGENPHVDATKGNMRQLTVAQCVDCGETKAGRTFEANKLFYCNECWKHYIEYDDNKIHNKVLEDKASVKMWFSSTVGLPQYCSLFINNGYESLAFIAKIKSEKKLMLMGINLQGHLT
eukprot:492319_1